MSRGLSKATRLQRLESLLGSSPEGYTVRQLAERLGVHRTTVWRDLNEISCEVPVRQDGNLYLIDPKDYVSSVRLSRSESLILYLALRRLVRWPSHLSSPLALALQKLARTLREPSASQLVGSLQSLQQHMPTDPERARIWETLIQAWLERISVRISYLEFGSTVVCEHEIQPHFFEPGLLTQGVFLVGSCSCHQALKTFSVDRIIEAVLTTHRFERPDGLAPDTILESQWVDPGGGELTEVHLRFRDPATAQRVRHTVWIPGERIEDLPDGGIDWIARVPDVFELLPWIRGWGPDCEVIEPAELQEKTSEMEQSRGDVIMTMGELPQTAAESDAFYADLQRSSDGDRYRRCLQCGSCSGICPHGFLMDYPPRRILAALRAQSFGEALQSDGVWMCVACYACSAVCPAMIPLTEGLMTRVKQELVQTGRVPSELQDALENSQRYGNPLGKPQRQRGAWTKSLEFPVPLMSQLGRPVDILWFVGDYASYHPRVQVVTIALARLFHLLDVDFAILGPEECSDGDSQRLAGEHGLFEVLAEKNGQAFKKYQFGEILTSDPHAYNAIKNEYPELGVSYPVRHVVEYFAERLDDLSPRLTHEIEALVAYHDPCYLGRVNGIYEEPRALLRAIPGVELVEMSHTRSNSLCCGGGGGGMWLDGFQWEKAGVRLSEWRVREAMAAGGLETIGPPAQAKPKRGKRHEEKRELQDRILAVACPYEAPRFEDAAKTVDGAGGLAVRDVAELLLESIGQ
ncbi:MAG TPA: WYL domain-containing protein [Anaerolineales bacterium]|nr:WYL domain-containing protein [Anaerolineales bacterium]